MARKILLADDSVTAQNMGRKILEDAGYEVVTVNNGSAALKRIAELKPDLIVLDVYMPGYGGLEVCQRLKENAETARTPVLLTVGKLEPFKAEEARRVRADAFIVKPFEANELVTALTKLEDRIVPPAEATKRGRFAQAIAAVEQAPGKAGKKKEDFGDADAGWKNRISIPAVKPKLEAHEPEQEFGQVSDRMKDVALRELEREQKSKPSNLKVIYEDAAAEQAATAQDWKADLRRDLPDALPGDMTLEEISAITAAAAALNRRHEEAPVAGAKSPVLDLLAKAMEIVASTPEVIPAKPTLVPALTVRAPSAPEPQVLVTPAMQGGAEAVNSAVKLASDAVVDTPMGSLLTNSQAVTAGLEVPTEIKTYAKADDAEMLAALASLTPSNGDRFVPEAATSKSRVKEIDSSRENRRNSSVPDRREKSRGKAAEIAEVVAVVSANPGPRWMAMESPILREEASVVLDHEMEQAYAVFAAAEAARRVENPGIAEKDGALGQAALGETALAETALALAEIADVVEAPMAVPVLEAVSAPTETAAVMREEVAVPSVVSAATPIAESAGNESARVVSAAVGAAEIAISDRKTNETQVSKAEVEPTWAGVAPDGEIHVVASPAVEAEAVRLAENKLVADEISESRSPANQISESLISENQVFEKAGLALEASAVPVFESDDDSNSAVEAASPNEIGNIEAEARIEATPSVEVTEQAKNVAGVQEASEEKHEFAHAAAAAAGVSSIGTSMDLSTAEAPTKEVNTSFAAGARSEAQGQKRETELAAAWASWRQIREAPPTHAPEASAVEEKEEVAEVAEVAEAAEAAEVPEIPKESVEVPPVREALAPGFRQIRHAEVRQPETRREEPATDKHAEPEEVAAEPEKEGEGGDISSIVDSMLADLKPKLMEEIARKMARKKD